jgi:hypothetical protein
LTAAHLAPLNHAHTFHLNKLMNQTRVTHLQGVANFAQKWTLITNLLVLVNEIINLIDRLDNVPAC